MTTGELEVPFDCASQLIEFGVRLVESISSELFASPPLIVKCRPGGGIGNLGCIMNGLGGPIKGLGKKGGRLIPNGRGPE